MKRDRPRKITKLYSTNPETVTYVYGNQILARGRAMTANLSKDHNGQKELEELIGRLRGIAAEMKSLSNDRADFRQKLTSLGSEVNFVGSRLRRLS